VEARKIEVLMSKVQLPIIQVEHNGHMLPIHSKYNPITEAERLVDSYKEQIEQADHIFFYGVGLGYHVALIQKRYPNKIISTYEPITEIYHQFINNSKKIKVKIDAIENQYIGDSEDQIIENLKHFRPYLAQNIVIIVLPVYEKIALESFQQFSTTFQQFIQETRTNTMTNLTYNDRWIINMIMNTPYILTTPGIQESNLFEDKPVILVAAGPSLTEELVNLREIKDKGLAFIFAVGSANEALIEQNILPDAVLSYDPSSINYQVFLELAKNHDYNIPLIFGTTIGHETLSLLLGPKAHVVMNRDKLTTFLQDKNFKTVNDSGTISNVALQLLAQLRVKTIILVGQNFALKKDAFYPQGIKRFNSPKFIKHFKETVDSNQKIYVEDVHGELVQTIHGYNHMRLEMERYIEQMPNLKIINTTKGGAKIVGTIFKSLSDIIHSELTEKIVNGYWWNKLSILPVKISNKKINILQQASLEYRTIFSEIMALLEILEKQDSSKNGKKVNQMLDKMYKLLSKLTRNQLFQLVVEPIISVHTDRFYSDIKICQRIKDNNEKIQKVTKIYRNYMLITLDIYRKINPIIQLKLIPFLKENEQWQYYEATCGIIAYEGQWRKKWFLRQEDNGEIDSYGASSETMQKGAIFQFKFTGTSFQLIGTSAIKSTLKLKISIDQQEQIVSIYEHINEKFSTFHHQVIFEILGLSEGLHEVTVEILSDNVHFNLLGLYINKTGRVYHIDEVEKIEDLTIGKRIRCHYQAKFNLMGEMSNLGNATTSYLPTQATASPNGDFYFIMVDERDGKKVLISDRVLQNRISKSVIEDKKLTVDGKTGIISLLSSSISNENSEWDRYLVEQPQVKCDNLHWHADSFTASWVDDIDGDQNEQGFLRGSYIGEDGSLQLDNGFDYICTSPLSEPLKMTGYRPKLELF